MISNKFVPTCQICGKTFATGYSAERHSKKKIPCNRTLVCIKCDKTFRDITSMRRHQNRKTSCEPINGDPTAPMGDNTCRFCCKKFKSKYTLKSHYSTCNIKNGGINILFKKIKKMEERVADLELENKKLKTNTLANSNNINNNNTNSNNTVNIVLNSYKNPNMEGINISNEDIRQGSSVLGTVMESIFFNPEKPENHSVLLQNVKKQLVAVYDERWKLLASEEERTRLITYLIECAFRQSASLLTNVNKTPAIQNRITAFNAYDPSEASLEDKDVLKILHKNKPMIEETKTLAV